MDMFAPFALGFVGACVLWAGLLRRAARKPDGKTAKALRLIA